MADRGRITEPARRPDGGAGNPRPHLPLSVCKNCGHRLDHQAVEVEWHWLERCTRCGAYAWHPAPRRMTYDEWLADPTTGKAASEYVAHLEAELRERLGVIANGGYGDASIKARAALTTTTTEDKT